MDGEHALAAAAASIDSSTLKGGHHHQHVKKGDDVKSKGVPITQDNFLGAIAECLEEDERGKCPKYGRESEYGEMKDWNVSAVTDMDYAFHNRESFDGDVSRWDTR